MSNLTISKCMLGVALLATLVVVIVPLYPIMPGTGIDQSWILAINEAVGQNLDFGKQIIFTFGPYAAVYTGAYSPATDHMMIGGAIYIAICYFIALMFLVTRKALSWPWILLFCFIFLSFPFSADSVLFVYPFLCSIVILWMVNERGRKELHLTNLLNITIVSLTFSTLGFLPLTKGSALFACLPVWVICCAFLIAKHRHILATAAFLAPLSMLLFAWGIAGQYLSSLPFYFSGLIRISLGYSAAMSLNGSWIDILLYLLASMVLIRTTLFLKGDKLCRVFIFISLMVILFLAFKAGFVRHDGHALRAAATVVLMAVVAPLVGYNRTAWIGSVVCIACAIGIGARYKATALEHPLNNIASHFISAERGLATRVLRPGAFSREYAASINAIRWEAHLPVLQGTADIYPWNLSYLIASGNKWNPRPVFQSYFAYTIELAELNAEHLIGRNSPTHVFFSIDPIDGRFPALQDGASWPTLLSGYSPVGTSGGFVVLARNGRIVPHLVRVNVPSRGYRLGQPVDVPSHGNFPVYTRIVMEKTVIGRLFSVLFHLPILKIDVTLRSGATHSFRFVPNMAKAGMLISPLVSDTNQFVMLYAGGGILRANDVVSFRIVSGSSYHLFWKPRFDVGFWKFPVSVDKNALRAIGIFEPDEVHQTVLTSNPGNCQGNLDVLDGVNPAADHVLTLGNVVSLRGWLANSVSAGQVPRTVLVMLQNRIGESFVVQTIRTGRPDVNAYFHRPGLPNVGFEATFDVRSLPTGHYTLGIGYKESGLTYFCPQFRYPVTLGR